ncbi:MAG: hypothetical protein P4L26_09860 [Terracidiphilus sp.]|nr:hypothetical protein [Terracidiphilus sp.]
MKVKLVSEWTAAAAMGILVGLHSNWNHWHWHQLGRDAYLLHESQYFDKFFVSPASAIHPITTFVVAALILFAAFKALAFILFKAFSTVADRSEAATG